MFTYLIHEVQKCGTMSLLTWVTIFSLVTVSDALTDVINNTKEFLTAQGML